MEADNLTEVPGNVTERKKSAGVNGVLTIEDRKLTGQRPGSVLKSKGTQAVQ